MKNNDKNFVLARLAFYVSRQAARGFVSGWTLDATFGCLTCGSLTKKTFFYRENRYYFHLLIKIDWPLFHSLSSYVAHKETQEIAF